MGKIKDARKKKRLTLLNVADYCGVTVRSVCSWEKYDCVNKLEDAFMLSEILKVPLKELRQNEKN